MGDPGGDEVDEAATHADLVRALETRGLIGQAIGILMERLQVDADQAFDVLKNVSSAENAKLLSVAQHLVTTRCLGRQVTDPAPVRLVTTVPDTGLSPRELQVMTLVASGATNEEIARELFLGINTIKTYIRTAYRKAGVTRRAQAVIWGREHGLVVTDSADIRPRIASS
jgi:DNA-binding CsgD family transcriptional regulator